MNLVWAQNNLSLLVEAEQDTLRSEDDPNAIRGETLGD